MRPFNSPLECGLRTLFILNALKSKLVDLQRLVSYDYLLVHSADIAGGPTSLHPAVPRRGAELLVKRGSIQAGINLLLAKELIHIEFSPEGFNYRATELTGAFVGLLKSEYAMALKVRAEWVVNRFYNYTDNDLQGFVSGNVGRWGTEFEMITAVDSLEL